MEPERIELSQRERDRLKVLHEVQQGHGKQVEAAERLRLSARQVRRLLVRVRVDGDRGLIHRLRGRASNHKIPDKLQQRILARVRQRYADFGPTLATEPTDRYVYDPADPMPTHGGKNNRGYSPTAGPLDQRAAESRSDVLVYTTSTFQKDTEVTGPVALELYVSSSAVDTDFTGKLIDVWPNGFAQNLADGILCARYRNSFEKAELMKPGQVYKLTIDLWATSNVFLAGHKLRLEVASSNFPRLDWNPNTGESPESAIKQTKATNVIYHDRDHPSALVVSVVP